VIGFNGQAQEGPGKSPVRLSASRGRFVRAGFDAAQTTRDNIRHWSMADACSADAEAKPSVRAILRQRSRYEVLNNSYARGLVQMLANDTIGTGPKLQLLTDDEDFNDRIENDFAAWAEKAKLGQVLRLMRIARCQDGESFVIFGTNPKLQNAIKLKLDVIEADRIQGEDNFDNQSGKASVDGIDYDKWGNPVAYHVLQFHPGDDNAFGNDTMRIDAEYMLHTFVQHRPGLHRGVPELTAALPLFAQLRRYNLAVLSAAEAAADFSAVLYTDSPANGESDDIEALDSIPLERNMMLTMPAGWKLGQLESKHPTSNHREFVKCILSEIARCVCSTYGVVAGDFSGFNYASGRLDNQIYQKAILVDRVKWQEDVLDPLLSLWLREWSLVNGVFLPEDVTHEWFWDGFMHVDPTKEASAQETQLSTMTTSLTDEYAKRGKDVYKELRKIARERELLRKLGLTLEGNSAKGNQGDNVNE